MLLLRAPWTLAEENLDFVEYFAGSEALTNGLSSFGGSVVTTDSLFKHTLSCPYTYTPSVPITGTLRESGLPPSPS
eukprot:6152642-Alexandrium_andersonii.AAC.1